jgi:hypothetical protein
LKGNSELGPRVQAVAIPHMFNLDGRHWRRGPTDAGKFTTLLNALKAASLTEMLRGPHAPSRQLRSASRPLMASFAATLRIS